MRGQMEIRANSVGIVGWEEGGAGQIDSWLEQAGYRVACFVHPEDQEPNVDVEAAQSTRESKLFSYPKHDSFKRNGISYFKVFVLSFCSIWEGTPR